MLLPTHVTAEQIKRSVRPKLFSRFAFNAFTGFHPLKFSRPKVVAYTSAATVFLALWGISLVPNSVPDSKNLTPINQRCSVSPVAGLRLKLDDVLKQRFEIGNEQFKLYKSSSFGGMTSLTIRRLCDDRIYKARAWNTKDGLEISSVN